MFLSFQNSGPRIFINHIRGQIVNNLRVLTIDNRRLNCGQIRVDFVVLAAKKFHMPVIVGREEQKLLSQITTSA